MFVQLESRCGVGFLAKPNAEKLLLRKIGRKPLLFKGKAKERVSGF
jgi:hypothetical protein